LPSYSFGQNSVIKVVTELANSFNSNEQITIDHLSLSLLKVGHTTCQMKKGHLESQTSSFYVQGEMGTCLPSLYEKRQGKMHLGLSRDHKNRTANGSRWTSTMTSTMTSVMTSTMINDEINNDINDDSNTE
jgi:hypothetical protein